MVGKHMMMETKFLMKVWENGTTPISKSDIEAKLTQAQNE